MRCTFCVAVVACLVLAALAKADVYLSQSGSDQADGRTVASAVASLGKASVLAGKQLKARDCTIHLGPGSFSAKDFSIAPGTFRLTITGRQRLRGRRDDAATLIHGPLVVSGLPVTLSNLTLTSPTGHEKSPGQPEIETLLDISESHGVKLSACLFTGAAEKAVQLHNCTDWRVENCIFVDVYRCLFITGSRSGQIVNNTMVDERLGHGTNSLSIGRVELRDGCNHVAMLNNAFAPRDPDGKVLLIEGCGDDFDIDYNIWRGVITHQTGTEQQSTWQMNFRTLDAWQRYTASSWKKPCDVHSQSDFLKYDEGDDRVPRLVESAIGEYSGASRGVSRFESCEAPTTDFYGASRTGGAGTADIGAVALMAETDRSPDGSVFQINFPTAGRASVAVFDATGRQIQTLTTARLFTPGIHRFAWDRKDAGQNPVGENGPFEYRAVLSPDVPSAMDIAGPGCRWPADPSVSDLANNPQENGEGMWCDAAGNLYRVAPYDEAGSTILSVDRAAKYRWRNWIHDGTLVTGDENFIYVVGCDKHQKDTVSVERFPLNGTGPKEWAPLTDALPLGKSAEISPTGLATAHGQLYLSDGPHDRVLVFSLGSGTVERSISVLRPAGLAARDDGTLLVCSRRSAEIPGNVFKLATDGSPKGSGEPLTAGSFDDPVDLAVGTGNTLFVADGGSTQQVLQIELAPVAKIVNRFGAKGGYDVDPDPVVRPDRLMHLNHVAVSGDSLWVGQKEPGYARNRLVRYDLATGKTDPGLEVLSLEGQNGSCADPLDPSHLYSADLFRYSVDLSTGQWAWDRNYHQARWSTVKDQVGCSTASCFYVEGKRFFAATICNSPTTTSRTTLVYRFEGEQLIPCTAVGGRYFGPSFSEKDVVADKSGQWVWADKNGDGKLQDDEVTFVLGKQKDGMPFSDCTWGTYIERDGTIVWPGDSMHYLRPVRLDPTGKMPVYDWANAVTIKYQDFPERDERYEGRVDTDGTIYDLSTTKRDRMPPGYWGMGTVLTKLNAEGKKQFSVPVNLAAKGIAVDDNFVYVGGCFGPSINQYTKDGLLVRTFSFGHTSAQVGWFDFPTPINSVTDSKSGDSILTAEEQWFGRAMVFRVPGAVQRFSGEIPVR